ncbi:hypothetical protein S40288_11656 [Stachybotrys chartarum IBT 40288]|nr:hypothetical protein S40288_11656 [Stachybotrys chartarum IBT 40288]
MIQPSFHRIRVPASSAKLSKYPAQFLKHGAIISPHKLPSQTILAAAFHSAATNKGVQEVLRGSYHASRMSQSPQTPLEDIFADCLLGLRLAVERAPSVTKALQLSVLGLRLSRWGEAVDIYETPALGGSGSSPEDLEEYHLEARQALAAILTLLDAEASHSDAPESRDHSC